MCHNNIIVAHEFFVDNDFSYLALQLADNNLSTVMEKPINPHQLKGIIGGMIHGLSYLESIQVVHLDIKPDNILLINGVVKLADFGAAMRYRDIAAHPKDRIAGTIAY